jgi:hypothetical protein
MTRHEVIAMARESGFTGSLDWEDWEIKRFERFAKLVAAHEREACAKICDNYSFDRRDFYKGRGLYANRTVRDCYNPHTDGESDGAGYCADAIRSQEGASHET